MARDGWKPDDYVAEVRENTREYVEDLLRENTQLRGLTTTLESERMELEKRLIVVQTELDTRSRDGEVLEQKIQEIETRNREYAERYVEIEKQNADLANLYVASYRLHATLDRLEVISVIEEIIINLIGSEELAIFERDPEDSLWSVAGGFGIAEDRLERLAAEISAGNGLIAKVAADGDRYLAADDAPEPASALEAGLSACIPLTLDGDVQGVVAIFELLGHKVGFERVDLELLDLLATHAAMALYSSRSSDRNDAGGGGGR